MAQTPMRLSAGTKLGPYEILAPLGAGGMGEVYRARDTRLDRTVAIKVLPAHHSDNPDRRQRFEREARAISALQHPNICVLFDVGREEDIDYLVMEHLEGETLAERLRRGALPLDQARRIAIEITSALERAHQAGIVHRDLKPANIMLTKSGAKLMDFGLAKPTPGFGGPGRGTPTPSSPTVSLSELATPASPLTQKGQIVGTFEYIAPEVLRGAEADARSDLFSFGCVLYETITGRRAFHGESQLSVLASILEKEPEPASAIQPAVPPALEGIIRNCLKKDPDERYSTAHDVKLQLEMTDTVAPAVERKPGSRASVWIAAAALVVVAAAAGVFLLRAPARFQDTTYTTILAPEGAVLTSTTVSAGPVVVSPDGTQLAYAASQNEGPQMLWVRRLNSPVTRSLPGTEGAMHPFWSADGRSLGFFADRKLKKVSAEGGPAVALADAGDPRGGAWNRDGVILYAADADGPFQSIGAAGGTPRMEAGVPDTPLLFTQRYPCFLPDQRHYLFMLRGSSPGTGSKKGIYAGELGKPGLKRVLEMDRPSSAVYASGYIVYARDRTLMAQKFDAGRLELAGDPVTLAADVRIDSRFRLGVYSASQNGILAYQTGVANNELLLQEVAADGTVIANVGPPGLYLSGGDPHYWPDGARAGTAIQDPRTGLSDIWQIDLHTAARHRLSVGEGDKLTFAVSADGSRIAYDVGDDAGTGVMVQATSGAAGATEILRVAKLLFVDALSPDGKFVISSNFAQGKISVLAVPVSGGGPIPLVSGSGNNFEAQVSPDGKFMAYVSDQNGRSEVYVCPFPKNSGRWQVSQDGGTEPRWGADGKALYFFGLDNRLMKAQVALTADAVRVGEITPMFRVRGLTSLGWRYDVSRDGKRFLITRSQPDPGSSEITLVTNWTKALKP